MKSITDLTDFSGKHVLFRADFDVPVVDGRIAEPFRIAKQKEAISYLLDHGASVTLIAHITSIDSFDPIRTEIAQILGLSFDDQLILRENLRSHVGEEANDESFARELAQGHDLYVNNAFAVCHREHASVSAVASLLPAYAGQLVVEEAAHLSEVLTTPVGGKVIFMGGAKVSTKMPTIEHLLDKAEHIAVGGKLANELGTTVDSRITVPSDFIRDGDAALDIGPNTADAFAALARDAKRIVWNGPMGKYEDNRYANGTRVLAQAIADSDAEKIIGGGDTIAAAHAFGLLDRMGFVSTGGGAMLAFLAGQRLPGLVALGYYHD